MQTRKLYYENSALRQFTARVTDCRQEKEGFLVTLDATAFYPEGGGQASDTGTLNGVAVLDVQEKEDKIFHLCAEPLTAGTVVEGEIDWDRRFDLMQQHTGEHIVSGVIHRLLGYHNVGFHMGSEYITIDFDGPITQQLLERIEAQANRAVWEDIPVRCWYPEAEALAQLPYRSKRAIAWPVRIVQIPGIDTCACCGIHVERTGQVGFVKLFSCVKFHQGVRIEMACGGRALALLNTAWEQNRQVSQAFSAKVFETGAAAQKMNQQLAAEKYRAAGLQKQIFAGIAERCAGKGDVLCIRHDLTPAQIRELAEAVSAVCGGCAAIFSGTEQRFDVCLARPGGDLRELGRLMKDALCGRGGGKNGFLQGTVQADRKQVEEFFSGFWRFEG